MLYRAMAVMTASWLLFAPGPSAAQTGPVEVTFQVPLNLTELSADITQIRVQCALSKPEQSGVRRSADVPITNTQEFTVSGNQVVTTANVVVAVDRSEVAVGDTWNYACYLYGFSNLLQQWRDFDEAQQSGLAAYHIKPPTPPLSGSIVW